MKGREDLFKSLRNVLENLPSEIQKACEDDIVFARESKSNLPQEAQKLKTGPKEIKLKSYCNKQNMLNILPYFLFSPKAFSKSTETIVRV